jgi:hypothetical protein
LAALADACYPSSDPTDLAARDRAFAGLLQAIFDACAHVNQLAAYGASSITVLRAFRAGHLGYPALVGIRRAVTFLAGPVEAEQLHRLRSSPLKSAAAGDAVKEDALYRQVFFPAYNMFFLAQTVSANAVTGVDFVSGNRVTLAELRAIRALPSLPAGRKAWAALMARLTLGGKYWARPEAMRPGGELYAALSGPAIRNRLGKERRTFHRRFGHSVDQFLKLDYAAMVSVPDRSRRAQGEPLTSIRATAVIKRAERIKAMVPKRAELAAALREVLFQRLKSVPRNLPQVPPG